MAKPILGIFFSNPGTLDYPLSKDYFSKSYATVIKHCEKNNIRVVIVRGGTHIDKATFSKYIVLNQDNEYTLIDEPITLDVIWNRDSENVFPMVSEVKTINDPELDELCRDKAKTAQVFAESSPKTVPINSYAELEDILPEWPDDTLVIKPRYGEQGIGVYVIAKNDVKENLYDSWQNLIVQAIVESNLGVPGIVEGRHEFNVFMIDGVTRSVRLKKFPKGDFLLDVEIAWDEYVSHLSPTKLPQVLQTVLKEIDDHLKQYKTRIVRIDIANSANGYQLIEINSRPGVAVAEHVGQQAADETNKYIAEALIQATTS